MVRTCGLFETVTLEWGSLLLAMAGHREGLSPPVWSVVAGSMSPLPIRVRCTDSGKARL